MHPILFTAHLFGHSLTVHSYGVLLMIAFLASVGWACKTAEKHKSEPGAIDPTDILDASVWMILAGVVGARALFIALDWSDYRAHPATWFQIWEGGISFHGALLGGLIAMIVYCRIKKIPVLRFGDIAAAPVMLGYAIGRVGCFLNGCCYGAPTNLPWAVRFDDDGVWTKPSHPTQIYSTILSTVFFIALIRLYPRRKFDGQVFCWYMILAAVERFVMEIWRASFTSTVIAFGLTDVQFLCIALAAGGSIGLAILRRRAKANPAQGQPVLGVAQS
jgi:phosphatidylglycerol:prolipoprotein diacylglycerol transferase